jgi:hypothetical protein
MAPAAMSKDIPPSIGIHGGGQHPGGGGGGGGCAMQIDVIKMKVPDIINLMRIILKIIECKYIKNKWNSYS